KNLSFGCWYLGVAQLKPARGATGACQAARGAPDLALGAVDLVVGN
ncbi:hypothetical protein A2U01_0103183, partial [Trifolium medium]|nr:hypothetical protein [Trifolium medium]